MRDSNDILFGIVGGFILSAVLALLIFISYQFGYRGAYHDCEYTGFFVSSGDKVVCKVEGY